MQKQWGRVRVMLGAVGRRPGLLLDLSWSQGRITGLCQGFDGVRVRKSRQGAWNWGLKSPKDSWALQGPSTPRWEMLIPPLRL